MIFSSFFAAVGQVDDPRFRRVLFLGVALTIALLVAVTAGFVWWINWAAGDQVFLPIIGEVRWLNDLPQLGVGLFDVLLVDCSDGARGLGDHVDVP